MLRSRLACVPLALALVLVVASAGAPGVVSAAGSHSPARFSNGTAPWKLPRIASAIAPAPSWRPIIDVVTKFSVAVVRNKQETAYHYLTVDLHKQAQQVPLDRMLGLQARPSHFSYRPAAYDGRQATVTVTYYLASGRTAATDRLGLERTDAGWRIARISQLPR